jgi:hypothetical protein
MTAAIAVSTGSLANALRETFEQTLIPQAPKAKATQTATITHSAIISLDQAGLTADVLVYGQLKITNNTTGAGQPTEDAFGAVVTVQRVGQRWLASRFGTDADTAESVPAGETPGSPAVSAATSAGVAASRDLITFSRKTFTADFNRALAMTTDPLRSDLVGERTKTLQTMTTGHFDLSATPAAFGVESASGSTVVLLITVNGRTVADTASKSAQSVQRFELTMTEVGNQWLASNLESVAIG